MTQLTRADLARIFDNDPIAIRAFEEQQRTIATASEQLADGVASTDSIQNATVVTLSPNDAFGNERRLAAGTGLALRDNGPGGTVVIGQLYDLALGGGYRAVFNLEADTSLDLPSSGRVMVLDDYLADGPYADDAAAATGGVAVGRPYRKTGGTVAWRVV